MNASDLEVLFSPNRKPMFAGKPAAWWHKNGKLMAQQSAFLADTDCRELVGTVLELQRDDYWRKFSDDWGQFCQETFGRPAQWVEQVVEGVRLLHGKGHAGAITQGQARQMVIDSHGGDRRSAEARTAREDQGDIITLKRGTQAAYIRARLERDHPDVAEALARGEHRSARAAAIAAGIIKDVRTVRLTDPAKAAASIVERMGVDWATQLTTQLAEALTDVG